MSEDKRTKLTIQVMSQAEKLGGPSYTVEHKFNSTSLVSEVMP